MNRIAERVEQDPTYPTIINAQRSEPEATGADAISLASRQIAETLNLSAMVSYTASGATGLRAARDGDEKTQGQGPHATTLHQRPELDGCPAIRAPGGQDRRWGQLLSKARSVRSAWARSRVRE